MMWSAGTTCAYDSTVIAPASPMPLGKWCTYNLQNLPVAQKDAFGTITGAAYELDGKVKDVRRGKGRNSWRTI